MSSLRSAALVAVLALLVAAPTGAQADPPLVPGPSVGFDGEVNDIAIAGPTAYVAGSFGSAGENVGGALSTDAQSGARLPTGIPAVKGLVRAIEPDGAGGWYVGGNFNQVGETRIRHLAHVRPDGTVDPAFTPPVLGGGSNGVTAIVRFGLARLAVAGDFRCVGGDGDGTCGEAGEAAQHQLTSVNPVSGAADPGFFGDTGLNGRVETLLVTGTRLVAGGTFTCAGGDADATCGEAGETTHRHLVSFTSAGARDGAWSPGVTWTGNASGTTVLALATDGTRVVAGGRFTCAGGNENGDADCTDATEAPRRNVAAFGMPGTSEALGTLAPNPNSFVLALAFGPGPNPDRLYLGGSFSCLEDDGDGTCEGGEPARAAVAAWQLTPNEILSPWNPSLGPESSIVDLRAGPDAVHLAGTLRCLGANADADCVDPGETPRRNAAAVDPATAAPQAWNPSLGRGASVIGRDGAAGPIAVGGDLRVAGAVGRSGVAAVDLRSGALLPWNPDASGSDDKQSGQRIAVSPDARSVYAAMSAPVCSGHDDDGDCTDPGETDRGSLVAFDAATGAIDPAFAPRPEPGVRALAVSPGGTVLIAGMTCLGDLNGACGDPGETPRPGHLAALTSAGTPLPWAPAVNGEDITDLVARGDRVHLTGDFSCANGTDAVCGDQAGEVARVGGAAFDVASGTLTAWDPQLSGPFGNGARDLELAPDGSRLLAAGSFTSARGSARPGLVATDPETGSPQAWGPGAITGALSPPVETAVYLPSEGTVVLGGVIDAIDGAPRERLAGLRAADGLLGPWAPGLTETIFRMASAPGVLVLAGPFELAGGRVRMGFARFGDYQAPPAPPAPPAGGPGAVADRTAPVIGRLTMNRRFRRGTGLVRPAAARPPTGTTIRFSLSEDARVRFTVVRRAAGRRSGARCVAPTRRTARARRCVRVVAVRGSATVTGRRGANRIRFSGRLSRSIALRPGRYVLSARATDAAGNRSPVRSASFTLLGPARRR
jgi:hypothetical protein